MVASSSCADFGQAVVLAEIDAVLDYMEESILLLLGLHLFSLCQNCFYFFFW